MASTTDDATRLADLYLRLSIAKDGADSLERQEADLRQWAEREGLAVRRVWRDSGRSGYSNIVREGFDAALAAVRDGEVRTLAVWKLDRLSRRGAGQVGQVLDDVEKAGGRLVFLRDGLDTSTGTSARLPIVTLSEIARAESANTSLRVKSHKDRSRAQGRYLGGPAPFGYSVDAERKLRPAEPGYSLMREAVSRVLGGESLLAVCRDWNAREEPTGRTLAYMRKNDGALPEKPGQWSVSALSAALRSPTLAGLMPQKVRADDGAWVARVEAWRDPETGETVSILAQGCEAIAPEAEQARMLAVMDGRLRAYGRGKRVVRQPASLLGGLLFCAGCEKAAHTFGNSYRCRKWQANGNDCPTPLSVSVDVIDTAVARAWSQKLASLHDDLDSPVLHAVAARWLAKNDPGPLREREELQSELDDARARMDRADDDHYVKGTLDAERHARVTVGLRDRITNLNARLLDLPEPVANLGALLDPELSLPALAAATVPEARELLRLAIVRVTVQPAPRRGVRFDAATRMRIEWVGETISD